MLEYNYTNNNQLQNTISIIIQYNELNCKTQSTKIQIHNTHPNMGIGIVLANLANDAAIL